MAYFEDLAADLDRARPSGTLSSFVKDNARYESLPFDFADAISVVPDWTNISQVENPVTTYLAKLGKWLTDGIVFDPNAGKCCDQSEPLLIESIRRNQHEEFIEYMTVLKAKTRPAVIFTIGGVAFAYKKSVGTNIAYGLRESTKHNIGTEMFAKPAFRNAVFSTDEGGVIAYELKPGETFNPIRPAVTSFDRAERVRFANRQVSLRPLVRAAITLSHDTVVSDVDEILREQKEARGQ